MRTSFVNCDLVGTEFHEARFDQTDLRGAVLAGLNLRTQDLRGVILTNGQVTDLARELGIIVIN